MKTTILSKSDFTSNIISFFEEKTGVSIDQSKKQIKAKLVIDKWGNTQNERMSFSNVTLFYCNNSNYCGGLKNGYGKGWYISNQGFTGGSTIKIASEF